MLRFRTFLISLLTAALLCLGGAFALAGADTAPSGDVTPEQMVKMASVQVPFVPNEGQVNDEQVKYYTKTFAGTVFVTNDGIIYDLPKDEEGGWVLKEEFAGGKALTPAPASEPGAPVSYFIGSDSGKWRQSMPSYDEITLGEVYDKINVNLRAYGNNVEKIFTVAPGGDPGKIALKVAGADKLTVNEQGELELATGLGTVKLTRPAAYQVIDGRRVDVEVAYVVNGDSYGFKVGEYNRAYFLVIDPLLASTFLGGSGTETGYSIALDKYGYVYVAGTTSSSDFPVTAGRADSSYNDTTNTDVFVAKLSCDLTRLLAAAYLGGGYNDSFNSGNCLAVAPSGEVYLAGYTQSPDFPSLRGTYVGGEDVFVAKLKGDLSQFSSSALIGGSSNERPNALAIDSAGNDFIAGTTYSSNYPKTDGTYTPSAHTIGTSEGFVTKFSGVDLALMASTLIGGDAADEIWAMALDSGDNVYIAGNTIKGSSVQYPTTAGAYLETITKSGRKMGVISELDNNLSQLKASTYIGSNASSGSSVDTVSAIALDSNNDVYVAGNTNKVSNPSRLYPTTTGAYNNGGTGKDSGYGGFVTKINGNLTGPLLYSTFIGGGGDDCPYAIALDSSGNVYIAGSTYSADYPITTGGSPFGGENDSFVSKLNGTLSNLEASTNLGGTGSDAAYGLALDTYGNVHLIGLTAPSGITPTPGACQPALSGASDAFVAKFTGELHGTGAPDTAPVWLDGSSLTVSNVTYSGLTLTWTPAIDNVGVTAYQIYQDGVPAWTVSSAVYTTAGGLLQYSITGLNGNTAYTFQVEAVDANNNWSSGGPAASVTTPAVPDTIPPRWDGGSLTYFNLTDTGVTLSWSGAADDVGVAGYHIYDSSSGSVIATVYGSTTYSVAGLTASTTYTFQVQAFDAAGNLSTDGPSVDVTTAEPADTVPPVWPSGSSLTLYQTSATTYYAVWPAASDNKAVTGYQVYQDGTLKATVGSSTLLYEFTGLSTGTTSYTFSVRAVDAAGNASNELAQQTVISAEGGFYLSGAYLTNVYEASPGMRASTTGDSIVGSSKVPLRPTIKFYFTNNVVSDAAWAVNSQSVTMRAASGENVPVELFRIPDTENFDERNSFFLKPVNELAPGTRYEILLSKNIRAKNPDQGTLFVDRTISFTTASALDTVTEIAADGSNKNLAVAGGVAGAAVTIPAGVTDATLDVSSRMGDPASGTGLVTTSELPALTINAYTTLSPSPVQVAIPAGATLRGGPDWNGIINLPRVMSSNGVAVTPDTGKKVASVDSVIEIGFGDVPLTLSKAARIVFPGQAGKDAGYYRGITFTKITRQLSEDTQAAGDALPDGGDGRIDAGSDLVIWTKHFTQFVIYSQTSAGGSGGSGGGSVDNIPPEWPPGSTLSGTKTGQKDVYLSWTPATDNVGVTGYKIYMEDTLIGTVNGSTTSYHAANIEQGPHTYTIQAGDAAGNWTTDGPSTFVSGQGNNPLNFLGAFLATINGSTSTLGDPVSGSSSVPVKPLIALVFDRNVVQDLIWPGNQQCFSMKDSSGASVDINVERIAENFDERRHIFISPVNELTPGETYSVTISKELKANNGNTLNVSSDVTFSFTVADTGRPQVSSSSGSASVLQDQSARVSYGEEAVIDLPAGSLREAGAEVKIVKVALPPPVPAGCKMIGDVFEFTVGGRTSYNFAKKVKLTFKFDVSAIGADEVPAIHYYDETARQWVNLGGTISGNTITVEVDHLTKFAVFAVKKTAAPVVQPGTLTDIVGHWAEADIKKLVGLGAVSGYPDGTFKPDSIITRAEFATVLVKAFKLDLRTARLFKDTAGHWARDYISTAAVFGIVNGYDTDTFGPDDPITREQMAVMIVRAAKLEAVNEETAFADGGGISGWARADVAAAVKNGIMKGYPDGTFRPQGNATRAEAVTVIVNTLRLQIH